jgi:protein-disulfide isomerase
VSLNQFEFTEMKRLLPFLIIVAVLGAVLGFGLHLWRSDENSSAAATRAPTRAPAPLTAPEPGAEPAHVRGAADAAVTIEEFADFECPACANFHPLLKAVEGEYDNRVRVIFRHFPLPQHRRAVAAAYAAEAAGLQGKFWEMHDKLYQNRDSWTRAFDVGLIFEGYARDLRLDIDSFKRDQSDEKVKRRVQLDFQRGRSLKIKGTPSVHVNGVDIPYSQVKTLDALRAVLNDALTRRSQPSS